MRYKPLTAKQLFSFGPLIHRAGIPAYKRLKADMGIADNVPLSRLNRRQASLLIGALKAEIEGGNDDDNG